MTVVRYNDNRTEILRKEVLKPSHSVNIKVVRRLVHKDYIRISEKCLCEQYLDLFVTCKTAHLSVHNTLVKTKTLYEL